MQKNTTAHLKLWLISLLKSKRVNKSMNVFANQTNIWAASIQIWPFFKVFPLVVCNWPKAMELRAACKLDNHQEKQNIKY